MFECESRREEQFVTYSAKTQTINDIVYDQISLPHYCWTFINEPAMQRLKNIY